MKFIIITSIVALAAAAPIQQQRRDPQYGLGGLVGNVLGGIVTLPVSLGAGLVGGLAGGVTDAAASVAAPFLPWNWRQIEAENAPVAI